MSNMANVSKAPSKKPLKFVSIAYEGQNAILSLLLIICGALTNVKRGGGDTTSWTEAKGVSDLSGEVFCRTLCSRRARHPQVECASVQTNSREKCPGPPSPSPHINKDK